MSGWIAVDLDGTLAKYDGWKGLEHIGEPIPEMLFRVRKWLADGKTVKIFTARACVPECIPHIHTWCREHLGQALDVTNVKDFGMIELWDDRAVRVIHNVGSPCCTRKE